MLSLLRFTMQWFLFLLFFLFFQTLSPDFFIQNNDLITLKKSNQYIRFNYHKEHKWNVIWKLWHLIRITKQNVHQFFKVFIKSVMVLYSIFFLWEPNLQEQWGWNWQKSKNISRTFWGLEGKKQKNKLMMINISFKSFPTQEWPELPQSHPLWCNQIFHRGI